MIDAEPGSVEPGRERAAERVVADPGQQPHIDSKSSQVQRDIGWRTTGCAALCSNVPQSFAECQKRLVSIALEHDHAARSAVVAVACRRAADPKRAVKRTRNR